ncbi:MAG: hypothetical protein QMC97_04550 [Pseudothermotoga sp.]|uniref:hypothetical protein n=1 Tax=Pseudothermotoga sp. TaxID=2033661 RepID=UPI00258D1378|nr:hypothetical protein [Pseudothermotoga sp.]MDI6862636.1 hypothetical protein [Pseudothermotoga sp.]
MRCPHSIPCYCGMKMRHGHGWSSRRPQFFGCHRPSKESLREYKRWLEEEMKLVDEELKREETQ